MEKTALGTEWTLLQNQFDSYEKHSLYIKLLSVITLVFTQAVNFSSDGFIVIILFVFWLQDAIWKTFQSRIEPRLFQLEQAIRQNKEAPAFQFNSEYQKVSVRGAALLVEYCRQAIRPTIAFPHIVLIAVAFYLNLFN